MIYNTLGLIFDLFGVILLFRFGILPDNLWNHILMDNEMSEKDEKRHKIWSKIAISLIFIGFTLQLLGSLHQHINNRTDSQQSFKNLNLGKEKNQTSGITATLKLKYDNKKLYYQLKLNGLTDSYKDISNFVFSLEDKDGFEISEITEKNSTDNVNSSRLYMKDSLIFTIKNSIPYSEKDYSQIRKWNLKITK
ncbi:hypothetical protein [Flavobacterium sedimenticola]|uniref:Uncharacterized protein n=1 Tax=Flavobacterium sedimenticola TaxID=3043286 RepID=A0ABT6XP74_9FLAO|nr:hypothetical protein [Flavobacterium sedimenticola]MDI9256880.1 hypothetical protein [Flavobacterium sedimenticola]